MPAQEGARIYNLFPRLVGRMQDWNSHFDRIKAMGFNWIYINPFHYPGFSGSLYAPKDYYAFNPLFMDESSVLSPMKQMEAMLSEAHKRGLKVMMDLVINHTAKDHPFTEEHPNWYKKNEKGGIKSPGAWDNGQWIEWGDLAEVDNENSPDKYSIWEYWKNLVIFYIEKGFDGFRADAAYQVPAELWVYLIQAAKKKRKDSVFFAESLGCNIEQTLALAKAGFDFIFNSAKWWDMEAPWLLEQYNQTKKVVSSIAFPESHDTIRLSEELKNNQEGVKQKTIFTAFFSSGWMMPIGFEYGFQKKLDVVKMLPSDWESVNYDLTAFIKRVNETKKRHSIFNEESDNEIWKQNNPLALAFLKTSRNKKEKALFLFNRDWKQSQSFIFPALADVFGKNAAFFDISMDLESSSPINSAYPYECLLPPCGVKILIAGSPF
jgi:glycosidase